MKSTEKNLRKSGNENLHLFLKHVYSISCLCGFFQMRHPVPLYDKLQNQSLILQFSISSKICLKNINVLNIVDE